ncbi:MAG TPA: hypothetical protein VLL25_09270 [Acidimicrobiales bacterium]|nr:hypothetical protein [Acidimicrobiales bacterium]
MLAALQLTNLLYVVAAIVVATLISGLIALRHRRPKSLESGIESFSRELRALAPEREEAESRAPRSFPRATGVAVRGRRSAGAREGGRRPAGVHYRAGDPPRVHEHELGDPGMSPDASGSPGPRDAAESIGTEGQTG